MDKLLYISEIYEPEGDLKGIPLPIIDRMLYHQTEQGNDINVDIFEESRTVNRMSGGFDWDKTGKVEGNDYWSKILNKLDFRQFYETHPEFIPEDYFSSENPEELFGIHTIEKDMNITQEGDEISKQKEEEEERIQIVKALRKYNEFIEILYMNNIGYEIGYDDHTIYFLLKERISSASLLKIIEDLNKENGELYVDYAEDYMMNKDGFIKHMNHFNGYEPI